MKVYRVTYKTICTWSTEITAESEEEARRIWETPNVTQTEQEMLDNNVVNTDLVDEEGYPSFPNYYEDLGDE